jgi:hypothetical protein
LVTLVQYGLGQRQLSRDEYGHAEVGGGSGVPGRPVEDNKLRAGGGEADLEAFDFA